MVGNDSSPHLKMFGLWRGFQTPKCRNERDIQNSRPKYKFCWRHSILPKNINFSISANYQSCFTRTRQSVLSDFRPNFWTCLDKNDIQQNEKDKTCVVIKCLRWLVWNGTFRGRFRSLFSWIGNFFSASARCRRYSRYVTFVAICWNILYALCVCILDVLSSHFSCMIRLTRGGASNYRTYRHKTACVCCISCRVRACRGSPKIQGRWRPAPPIWWEHGWQGRTAYVC